MNARGKPLNPKFNAGHVTPLRVKKAASVPSVTPKARGLNPKLKPPRGPCPTGASVCKCNPKMVS